MIRRNLIATLACGALCFTGAWADDDDEKKTTTSSTTTRTTTKTEPPAQVVAKATTDAEIIAKLMAIDQHEVKLARTAERKQVSAPVLDYAKMLRDHHELSLQDTRDLSRKIGISPKNTAAVTEMRKRGTTDVSRLQRLDGDEFEREFATAAVAGHDEALAVIDEAIGTAVNPDLVAHLRSTRERIAAHLAEAQELQVTLSASR